MVIQTNFKFSAKLFGFCLILLLLPNCAKYKPSPLPYPTGKVQEAEKVQVVTRKLSQSELESCFDSSDISNKYEGIQICVKNNRSEPIVLAARNIDASLESSKIICEKLHRCTAGRVAGYCAGGLLLWPLFIPAAVDGAKSSKANYKINQDVSVKVLGQNESTVIDPNRSINKVFFVPRSQMKPEFGVTLIEESSRKEIKLSCSTN